MNFCVYISVLCFLYFQLVSASHRRRSRSYIDFAPVIKRALTLAEFDEYLVGDDFAQLYRAGFTTRFNVNGEIFKPDEEPYVKLQYFNDADHCLSGTEVQDLSPVQTSFNKQNVDKATFYSPDLDEFTVYMSSCPSSYVIMFECDSVQLTDVADLRKCPVQDTFISILLTSYTAEANSRPNDILWYQIVKDLYKTTGIKFGSKCLTWTYTFGAHVDMC